MPAGSDFVCNNDTCEHCGKGLIITAPWPMGYIDKIVDAPNVVKHKEFREGLIKLKTDGHEYACINYPNVDEIETEAYRVHKWCPSCPCLWTYDAEIDMDGKTVEEIINDANLPETCPTCETELLDFNTVVEDGINCPACKVEMDMNPWVSNETTEESR